MTLNEQFDADVLATENEGGEQFLFQGRPFVCQRTPATGKLVMVDAGYELDFDLTIEVRTAQFQAPLRPPTNTDVITIDDVDYHVVMTMPDQFGIVNHYALKQET